jgi:hypothetical protein
VVMAPCRASAPSLNASAVDGCCGRRTAAHHGAHTSAHYQGPWTAAAPAASRKTTTPKTTGGPRKATIPKTMGGARKATATSETTATASAAVSKSHKLKANCVCLKRSYRLPAGRNGYPIPRTPGRSARTRGCFSEAASF